MLERLRAVAARKRMEFTERTKLTVGAPYFATMLDTKGPEIRTAMLKDHNRIDLVEGQDIIVEAVGAKYTEFEGYKVRREGGGPFGRQRACGGAPVGAARGRGHKRGRVEASPSVLSERGTR